MCRTATRSSTASSSTSSIGSVDYSYEGHDSYNLRSATPYSTLPRYATPLERSRSSDLISFSQQGQTPSSISTQLPYRSQRPLRSSSLDSSFSDSQSLEYLPYLSNDHSPPAFSNPLTPASSSNLDRAYESQERELEKCRLPRSAARRPGRQMSWEAPLSPEVVVALGASEERRTYDTLPIYASRAGSRRTGEYRNSEEEEEEYDCGLAMNRSWTGDLYVSTDELTEKRGREVSHDLVEEKEGRGYEGPSSRCLKGMAKARLGDALWSAGILVVFTLLFVVKAIWTEEIISSQGVSLLLIFSLPKRQTHTSNFLQLSFFILIFEHTLPSLVLCVYFSISFCRKASARIDADLFKKTRWGQDLNEEGWWIPSDEAEAGAR